MEVQQSRAYYLGLDCGTDSVGYAAADTDYALLRSGSEPVIGVTTFDGAVTAQERRAYRVTRRRLQRRRQRVQLVQELFAPAIAAVDAQFFLRLRESALYRDDRRIGGDAIPRALQKPYPTIHHLLVELMESDEPHDVRLVYAACAWLVAHRGHFLSNVSEDDLGAVLDVRGAYDALMEYFPGEKPWDCGAEAFGAALREKLNVRAKEARLRELLFAGKKPPDLVYDPDDPDAPRYSRAKMLTLLSGGRVKPGELFVHRSAEYEQIGSFSLGGKEEELAAALAQLGDDAELVLRLKALFDWAVLTDVLQGEPCISRAKVRVYEQHRADLACLKALLRKYAPEKYDAVFNGTGKEANYAAYSRHAPSRGAAPEAYAAREAFSEFLKKQVRDLPVSQDDRPAYEDMLARLDTCSFLPRQRSTDNRVIPRQLYAYELKAILARAERYLPFLAERDADGLSVSDKIVSVFNFRIPYFVGPLDPRSSHAWLTRKAGRIYPWNFESMVDLDRSEDAFIRRMTGRCSYLPGEPVLPKNALCYARFTVLNEINPLKVNGAPLTPAQKQAVYTGLFEKRQRVTLKALREFLLSEGYMQRGDTLSGVDEAGIKSALRPQLAFRRLLEKGLLTQEQAEQIIERLACTEDRMRLRRYLTREFPQLPEADVNYLARLPFKDFGRLSRRFLCGLEGANRETGEVYTVLQAMWETNCTLMELLSDRFTFAEAVQQEAQAYYAAHPQTLEARMDSLYLSPAVRRPIHRALAIVKDVVKAAGGPPSRIFIEMARGATEQQKGRRTVSRKEQLLALYRKFGDEEARALREQLEAKEENDLQSEKLFLYFMQLGRCMYSGQPISLDALFADKRYDIDHIRPQSRVKDESVWNNKALCLAELNGNKGDTYPIRADIRQRMTPFWSLLHSRGLMSDEKYRRLTRATPFTEEELMGFIQRQLVETRQSTKALATLLAERYPGTEIVYVKAGLVSDFRHEFKLLKCRAVNDLHHGKDAYLNIVVGNVYHERFSRQFFRLDQPYTLKTRELFSHRVMSGGRCVWRGGEDVARVRAIVQKDALHVTRFAFCRHGGLFDQQPRRAGSSDELLPRKAGLPVERYGGYRKPTASFFVLARYAAGRRGGLMVVPIDLMAAPRFLSGGAEAEAAVRAALEGVLKQPVDAVSLPLGGRILRVNTVFSLDGFRVALAGKSNGGKILLLSPLMPLRLGPELERYVKRLESFQKKRADNPALRLDPGFDRLTPEEDLALYDALRQKLAAWPYSKRPAGQSVAEALDAGRERFLTLAPEARAAQLLALLPVFGRSGAGCNLTAIGGAANVGVPTLSWALVNWKKAYDDVRIIDQSASGLFAAASMNLLELL